MVTFPVESERLYWIQLIVMLGLILEAASKTVIFVMIVPPRMIIKVKTIAANLNTWNEMNNSQPPAWKHYVLYIQWRPPDITPQMSPNEQVSSDHHQISLAGGPHVWYPRSESGLKVWCLGEIGYPTMWHISWYIWCYIPYFREHTDTCENIAFPQLCGR